jgi:type IV pilus assembly protein PilE
MKKKVNLKTGQSGFTLIEVMVVVAILAIIVSIAMPYYENQKRRMYRTDAINAIQTIAQLEERNKTVNGKYDTLANVGGSATSDEGKYAISVTQTDDTYTITATAQGTQLNDEDCRSFSLSNTGIRSSTDKDSNVSTGANSRCWPR